MARGATTVAVDLITWLLLLLGSFCAVVGGIGLLRLPDFFTRLHAAGVTDTSGAVLIMTGLMLQAGLSQAAVKLALILLFLLLSSPTASHALAQAALSDHLKPLGSNRREPPSTR